MLDLRSSRCVTLQCRGDNYLFSPGSWKWGPKNVLIDSAFTFQYSSDTIFFASVKGNLSHGMAFGDTVIETWLAALQEVVLKVEVNKKTPWGKPQYFRHNQKPHDVQVAIAHLPMQQVCEMLQVRSSLSRLFFGESLFPNQLGLECTWWKLFFNSRWLEEWKAYEVPDVVDFL